MPDQPELLEAAGQAQLAAGDTHQAVAAFRKLAQVRPGAPEPYIRMASAQMAAKDPDGAMQSLKKALALRPDLVNVQRAMIKVNLDAGREADALTMARDVQKQRPKESIGYMLEGDIYVVEKVMARGDCGVSQRTQERGHHRSRGTARCGTTRERQRCRGRQGHDGDGSRIIPRIARFARTSRKWPSARKTSRRRSQYYKAMLDIQPDDRTGAQQPRVCLRSAQGSEGARIRRESQQARCRTTPRSWIRWA